MAENSVEVKILTTRKAINKIMKHEGEDFTVTFIKRKDNSVRVMQAVRNNKAYKKLLKGAEAPFDFKLMKLLPVLDREAGVIKSIALDSMIALEIAGETYKIQD